VTGLAVISVKELRKKLFSQQINKPKPVCEFVKCYPIADEQTGNVFIIEGEELQIIVNET
jgi:hypothetical protein